MEKQAAIHVLTASLGYPGSPNLTPLLDWMLTDDEATLLASLPATPTELRERLSLGEAPAALMEDLFVRGLAMVTGRREDQPCYAFEDNPGRFMDMILFDPRYTAMGHVFRRLWQQFYDTEMVNMERSADALPFRVIPVQEQLADSRSALPYEQVESILRRAEVITVQECPCRTREEGCDNPKETCLIMDGAGRYMLTRGFGREITVDEALDILRDAEERGLVHEVENTERPTALCNCCTCCCVFLKAITHYSQENVVAHSRFRAEIDAELCIGCGVCQERCHFGAIHEDGSVYRVDQGACYGCGLCSTTCPVEAITMFEREPREFIPSSQDGFMTGVDGIPGASEGKA